LESVRTTAAHKLPGVAGSYLGSEGLCKGLKRDFSTATAGQSDSSSIHQQLGGHSVTPVDGSGKSPMNVGSSQGSSAICRAHSRDNKFCCGCRVQNVEESDRLGLLGVD